MAHGHGRHGRVCALCADVLTVLVCQLQLGVPGPLLCGAARKVQ